MRRSALFLRLAATRLLRSEGTIPQATNISVEGLPEVSVAAAASLNTAGGIQAPQFITPIQSLAEQAEAASAPNPDTGLIAPVSPGESSVQQDDTPYPTKGEILTGKTTNWFVTKGFGFITGDRDGRQYFVHFQSLEVVKGGYHSLINGQAVRFIVDIGTHSVTKDPQLKALKVTGVDGRMLPSGPRPKVDSNLVGRTPEFVKKHMQAEGVEVKVDDQGRKKLFFSKVQPLAEAAMGEQAMNRRPYSNDRQQQYRGGGGGGFTRDNFRGGPGMRGGRGRMLDVGHGQGMGTNNANRETGQVSFASFATSASSNNNPAEDNSFLGEVPTLEGFEEPTAAPRQRGGFSPSRGRGNRGYGGSESYGRGRGGREGGFRGREGGFRGREGGFRGRGGGGYSHQADRQGGYRQGDQRQGSGSSPTFRSIDANSSSPPSTKSPVAQQAEFDEL